MDNIGAGDEEVVHSSECPLSEVPLCVCIMIRGVREKEGERRGVRISLCRPRMAIIGSREQLCIHPEVSKKDTNFEKVRPISHVTTIRNSTLSTASH